MQRKKGFFIKNILAIGGKVNGEHRNGPFFLYDKNPIILNDGSYDSTRVDRIVAQIKSLGAYASEQPKYNIERLTRLVTDEFSFYTRATPLSIDEYRDIINKTSDALKDLPPNIVLVMSSMPVIWPDGSMRNAVLHIQSPNDKNSLPIIHHFSKESFSPGDPYYARVTNVNTEDLSLQDCYPVGPDDYSGPYSPDIVLKDTCASCHSVNQYKSAIVVRGVNIPPIIETIDICLDHDKQVAMRNIKPLIKAINKDIPLHISHIITSNTVTAYEDALVASPVHADFIAKRVGDVTEKKNETIPSHFGVPSNMYVYHQMRAEVLNADELEMAVHKNPDIFDMPVSTLKDNHQNTLLHQIFLPNKTSAVTPHQFRQTKNFKSVIPYFWGDAVNQQNKDGDTPLHLALKITDDENILLQLLEHGARLDIKNNEGKSPIQWAYENNKHHLIHLLITKLVNNKNVYLAHQATILSLLNDIKDEAMKRKVAASALCFEISQLSPEKIDEKKAIELLMIAETSPTQIFIEHNIGQLLTTFKKGMLYYYLVDNHAVEENKEQIATLPAAIHAHLLELDLSRKSSAPVHIDLYKKGLTQLLHHINVHERRLVSGSIGDAIKAIPVAELNADSMAYRIVPNLLTNKKLVDTILSHLPKIQDEDDKNKIVKNCIEQYTYLEIIKSKLTKGSTANVNVLTFAWSQLADIGFCDDESGLTVSEKIIQLAGLNLDPDLLDYIVSRFPQVINSIVINKITATLKDDKLNYQKWFYQNLLENELKRHPNTNVDMLLFTLSHYSLIDLNKPMYLSSIVAEDLILKACFLNRSDLLARVVQLMPSADISSMINKVIKGFPPNAPVTTWLYETLIKNELTHGRFANVDILSLALSQPIDYHQPGRYGTIAEELVAIAYMQSDTAFLDKLKLTLPYLLSNPFFINKVASLIDDKFVFEWLTRELIKNEFKRGNLADKNIIFNFIQNCDLSKKSGVLALTMGEQMLAQAFISDEPQILDSIKMFAPFLLNPYTIQKVSKTFQNQMDVQQWIYLTLVINELKRGNNADLNLIFFALSSSPVNLLILQGYVAPLNIGEQLFAQSYFLNDPNLFFRMVIFAQSSNINVELMWDKLSTFPQFPPEGVQWLRQQLVSMTMHLNNMLTHVPTPVPTLPVDMPTAVPSDMSTLTSTSSVSFFSSPTSTSAQVKQSEPDKSKQSDTKKPT